MKNKVLVSHLTYYPPTLRYPSPQEPHACQVLHSIACAVAPKSLQLATIVQFSSGSTIFVGPSRSFPRGVTHEHGGNPNCALFLKRSNHGMVVSTLYPGVGYVMIGPRSAHFQPVVLPLHLPSIDLRVQIPSLRWFLKTLARPSLVPLKTFPLPCPGKTKTVIPTPQRHQNPKKSGAGYNLCQSHLHM